MISELARNVTLRTQEYARLQQTVSQADSVRATERLLEEIGKDLETWGNIFPIIAPRLALMQVNQIRADATAVTRTLLASQDDFANQNFQQANRLTQLKARVEKLLASTKDSWSTYARAQIAPLRELADLAERLPNMAQHMEAIRGYIAVVYRLATELPANPSAVTQFDIHVARLKSLLQDLDGLPSDIREFLARLINNEATLADVTGPVYDWCRVEGLSDKLRVTRI